MATIDKLSVNAFKSIVDIDLIGSFVTVKATLPYLLESAKRSKTERGQGSLHSTCHVRKSDCFYIWTILTMLSSQENEIAAIAFLSSILALRALLTSIILADLGSNTTSGRIIFVTSMNYRTARPAQAHVCAAKSGVNALSDCLSIEYGPKGITSNLIAPGIIDGTEGMQRLQRPEDRGDNMRSIPVQRFGLVKDIADATVFLFGDTGSYINGACIDVDGGAWRIKTGQLGGGQKYPDFLDSAPSAKPAKAGVAKL